MIVTKMPAKSFATSTIGAQWKTDRVRPRPPAFVRRKQRSYEQHGGARRSHDAREQGAQCEQRRIAQRRRAKLTAHANAAGNREQREQDDDEGQVLGEHRIVTSCIAVPGPKTRANRINNASTHAATILPKWSCQNLGAISGTTAIERSRPAKGIPQCNDSTAPLSAGNAPST